MPRIQKSLNKQSQWTLILLGGLAFIYIGVHWQDFLHPRSYKQTEISGTSFESVNAVKLEISSLGITAPVIYSTASKASAVETELQSGVVHLADSADIGEVGNAYIVGHSSNTKNAPGAYNEIFARLPQIHVGDEIVITQGKKVYNYKVYETRVVEPTELWVMSQETSGAKILTLQTSYPVGTADNRFIAVARLE